MTRDTYDWIVLLLASLGFAAVTTGVAFGLVTLGRLWRGRRR